LLINLTNALRLAAQREIGHNFLSGGFAHFEG